MKTFRELLAEITKDHEHYYHVTPTKNLASIKKHGLKPSIGKSSEKAGEDKPRTYLFKHKEHAEDATANWLGDEHDEHEKLSLLKVSVHKHHVKSTPGAEYEHHTEHHIPPHHIKVLNKNF